MPEDELPLASGLVDHGWTVARLLGLERSPEFLAGVLVEGHHHAALAPGQTDELVAVEQGMTGKSPVRGRDAKILFEFARPKDLSHGGIETEQMSLRAE